MLVAGGLELEPESWRLKVRGAGSLELESEDRGLNLRAGGFELGASDWRLRAAGLGLNA